MKFIYLLLLLPIFNFSKIKNYRATYSSEITMEIMGKQMLLKSDVNVIANKNYTLISYDNVTSDSKANLTINFPDSIEYINSKWYNITEGIRTEIPFDNVLTKATLEYRTIFTFKCQKYLLTFDDGSIGVFWIAKDLPKNIIPFPALKDLPGAVLECEVPKSGIAFKLKKIYFDKTMDKIN